MKASELIKKEGDIEKLYQSIKDENEKGGYRILISPSIFISIETITELLSNGFKVYKVKDLRGLDTWCIEW